MAYFINYDESSLSQKQSGPDEYKWKRTDRIMDIADSKKLDGAVISLDPQKFSYPYHFHYNTEEMFVILSGSAMLRTPDGFREVKQGDVIFFEMGEAGAHQLYNHTKEPCVYLDLNTEVDVDLCEYPDTGKVNAYGMGARQIHYKKDTVGYFEGEENVLDKWKDALKKFK